MSWGCNCLPFVLFTSLSVLKCGITENLGKQVSLDGQQNDSILASILIVNTTSGTINNLSLQQDLDTSMDNSEKLNGVQGFVKDTKRNSSVDLPSFNDTSKNEEDKRLWSILCSERDEKLLNIVSRKAWGAEENVDRQRRTLTADLLIVDGHSYYTKTNNYLGYLKRKINTVQMKQFGDVSCNFWISDDGQVFEGIGWDYYNNVYNGGLGPRSLIIGFIKKETKAEPSVAANKAFRELVKRAICMGKLMLYYSLIPYYLVNDYHSIGNDSFERKEMRKWNSYRENLDFLVPSERDEEYVSQVEWSSIKSKVNLIKLSSPIEYIVVWQYSSRCFFNCSRFLQLIDRYWNVMNDLRPSNFIVAEDGRVYKVTGWEETWYERYQRKKAIQVGFLGQYNSYGPNRPILIAFKALIQDGLRTGKLSKHYKIVTINTVNARKSSLIGSFLEREIRKIKGYKNKF